MSVSIQEDREFYMRGVGTKYPYYNPSDDRWKNSVRHNLSINPHFRKGLKSRHGAGHLWTLSNEGVNPPPESWKRSRVDVGEVRSTTPEMVDEAALAAATIMSLDADPEPEPIPVSCPPDSGSPLHRVAEEILSGVKRRVEVQYLVHDCNTNGAEGRPDHTIVLTMPPQTSFLHPSS
ncbi:hypothetical protein J6590_080902 [Homalodisca vitripennis]|nr:hypothetical protein J6590_080902 [Homalodisca vitripennis]